MRVVCVAAALLLCALAGASVAQPVEFESTPLVAAEPVAAPVLLQTSARREPTAAASVSFVEQEEQIRAENTVRFLHLAKDYSQRMDSLRPDLRARARVAQQMYLSATAPEHLKQHLENEGEGVSLLETGEGHKAAAKHEHKVRARDLPNGEVKQHRVLLKEKLMTDSLVERAATSSRSKHHKMSHKMRHNQRKKVPKSDAGADELIETESLAKTLFTAEDFASLTAKERRALRRRGFFGTFVKSVGHAISQGANYVTGVIKDNLAGKNRAPQVQNPQQPQQPQQPQNPQQPQQPGQPQQQQQTRYLTPRDIEDCTGCRMVWSQVEMDLGNARYVEDVQASFEHNCMDAQKSSIFFEVCEDMYDDMYAMTDDYMSGQYSVDGMCTRAMMCRPDLQWPPTTTMTK